MPPTIAQLETFVSSPTYDADTAGRIAALIPALKAAGADGELISPGVRRIRGNLCNVHGKYGPCDKALSGKKKPKGRKPAAPKKTDAQRATERDQKRQANIDSVAKQMADNDTGLSPSGSKALAAFAKGQQPDPAMGKQLASMGLAEQAEDGSFRMTPTGRGVVSAMAAGDYQRAVDGISRGSDTAGKRAERQTAAQARQAETTQRRQAAAGKRAAAQVARGLTQGSAGERAADQIGRQLAKRTPAKTSGSKKLVAHATETPRTPAKPPRARRSTAPTIGGSSGGSGKPKPKPLAPEKAPAKQLDPKLTEAATALSEGAEVTPDQLQGLITNGLVKLDKNGDPVLTAAGRRATMKSHDGALLVFKDARGRDRWVAQSSTAYQDRDQEIVSTKALADDCERADGDGSYGPLRWWHTPGLDLGDCDFNAMHGRVLIESGTFRSPAIAQKVARAAADLEISLGFLHLPTEPDADGVFHHIRRFERSLVPRGKASNRFTAFTVKETLSMDATKVSALKSLGFSDEDIAGLQARAETAEKSAADQGIAFKAAEPAHNLTLNITIPSGASTDGVAETVKAAVTEGLKAFKPAEAEAEPVAALEVETDAIDDMPVDEVVEEDADPNALTLSPGDMAAITEIITNAVSQIMGGLDLEKKVASHVQGLLQPFQQAQATKETQLTTQVAELEQQVKELTGDQPAAPYRASAAKDTTLTDAGLLAAVKQTSSPYGDFDDIVKGLGLAR